MERETNEIGGRMNQTRINELHKILTDYAIEQELTRSQLLSFLSVCFIGTLAMADYDDAFVRATFAHMFIQYKRKKEEMKSEDE